MEPCNRSYIVPFHSIFYTMPILSTDVSKMHNNEAFLYFLQKVKDDVFTTTCICSILW